MLLFFIIIYEFIIGQILNFDRYLIELDRIREEKSNSL